jgi:hypothetical protein
MESLIRDFLIKRGWVPGNPEVSFLAAGEYNQNFLVRVGDTRLVLRVNHGSQLGLADQISYEYRVLGCVSPSGVTPLPFRVHPDREALGGGAMLMQWLPGEALDYERDWRRAAGIFARIHALPPCPELLVQDDPVASIAAESLALLERYPDHDLTRERDLLRAEHERILDLGQRYRSAFRADRLCVVNTEVNSGNFLITPRTAYLVDWEKAVVSSRYQDLAHFLAPTTTLWRTDTLFSPARKQAFLRVYRLGRDDAPSMDELSLLCRIMEQVIVLRGLSWCFMAHHEYARGLKALTSPLTRDKILLYMREMTALLAMARRADQAARD